MIWGSSAFRSAVLSSVCGSRPCGCGVQRGGREDQCGQQQRHPSLRGHTGQQRHFHWVRTSSYNRIKYWTIWTLYVAGKKIAECESDSSSNNTKRVKLRYVAKINNTLEGVKILFFLWSTINNKPPARFVTCTNLHVRFAQACVRLT